MESVQQRAHSKAVMEEDTPWVPLEGEVLGVDARQEAVARVSHRREALQSAPIGEKLLRSRPRTLLKLLTYMIT